MENKTLTAEEIKTIKDLQVTRDNIIIELGNIEAYLLNVSSRKSELQKELTDLTERDKKVGTELSEKYGNGSIDLEKGEFIPQD